jgi:hypothetical protein
MAAGADLARVFVIRSVIDENRRRGGPPPPLAAPWMRGDCSSPNYLMRHPSD